VSDKPLGLSLSRQLSENIKKLDATEVLLEVIHRLDKLEDAPDPEDVKRALQMANELGKERDRAVLDLLDLRSKAETLALAVMSNKPVGVQRKIARTVLNEIRGEGS
jgi:hypothetical protein